MASMDGWDPEQYRRFANERAQPFHDLLALVEPAKFLRAVDLGCGTGELTALAADRLEIEEILGIDHSAAMLGAASLHATPSVQFSHGDISAWSSNHEHDLILAAASLQWVPDHGEVLRRWTGALAPGGQIAVQVPANADSPTHRVASRLAAAEPYLSAFGIAGPPVDPVETNVLRPEQYAQLLYDLGFERQHVRMTVYPHVLPSSRDAFEWVKGTTLTRFKTRLSEELFHRFLVDYEHQLLDELGRHEPHFFPFRRILIWARLSQA